MRKLLFDTEREVSELFTVSCLVWRSESKYSLFGNLKVENSLFGGWKVGACVGLVIPVCVCHVPQ